MYNNRRDFIKNSSSLAVWPLLPNSELAFLNSKPKKNKQWPLSEGPSTPKMVSGLRVNTDEKSMRRLKQIGINYVSSVALPGQWVESDLRGYMDNFKNNGLTLYNLMYVVGADIILARPNRDEEINKIIESLKVAGRCGLANVEYNWYVDRLTDGYFEVEGRGGSGITGFDYSKVKDLPAKPEIGIRKADEIWANLEYFLKAVIPVAEKAGVRMACHPNDPVSQQSHGSDQILANLAGLKRLITIVDSPSNGITFDCGVTKEMGEDPVEVCKYFASRDRINHMHYRNVISQEQYNKYTECFIDEGQVNMFAVMQELIKHGYSRTMWAEHPHILDYDRDYPGSRISGGVAGGGGGGGYAAECFNAGFCRAMMWAVLSNG
ncbi:MAG: mannonate dehydratase [Saprospiraceae bacterium]|nr:mannonate dehydratase [Saprospiraceae bacterium]